MRIALHSPHFAPGQFIPIGGHSIGRIQRIGARNSSQIAKVAIDGVHPVHKNDDEEMEVGEFLHWIGVDRIMTCRADLADDPIQDIRKCAVVWLPATQGTKRVFARLLFGRGEPPPDQEEAPTVKIDESFLEKLNRDAQDRLRGLGERPDPHKNTPLLARQMEGMRRGRDLFAKWADGLRR